VTVKDLVRPIPGARQLSRLRQGRKFGHSAHYWELHYERGGTSGGGSYGDLGRGKAEYLNKFVRENDIKSIIEFGCGDGQQLSLGEYPRYVGLDVSRTAIALCMRRFANDPTKSFFLYSGDHFIDRAGLFAADLVISLDVVYHLVEDRVFETYMRHLFTAGRRFAVVYSTNSDLGFTAPHVRHRQFTPWAANHFPQWRLVDVSPGPNPGSGRPDFFVFERHPTGNP
jgi:cyclopropane fatty-acyl-phospholipid synthase-like methyltransferase